VLSLWSNLGAYAKNSHVQILQFYILAERYQVNQATYYNLF